MSTAITSPIFFVGMPRSGTTITFEAFSRHQQLGWLSNYSRMAPQFPAFNGLRRLFDNRLWCVTGVKKQYGKVVPGNRFLPQTDEAYEFWDHYTSERFSRSYLIDEVASPVVIERVNRAVAATLRWQGRTVFAAKLTGPARLCYLNSLFPDARFIHVIRDGRAVVNSLMKVPFWKEGEGLREPWWKGGFPSEYLDTWKKSDQKPEVLAALQWRFIVEDARREVAQLGLAERYLEVTYESFMQDPVSQLAQLWEFCGLDCSEVALEATRNKVTMRDMNRKIYDDLSEHTLREITAVMEPVISEFHP